MIHNKKIMDGCMATTHIAYALSDVAAIFPITPIADMGEIADKWSMQGRRNLMGQPMVVREMQSEAGAAGTTHGCLSAGALATTFTASQGLLLMIPNMYKIAGELLPGVFHVGTRSIAAHALSIFGDHQDVMACRHTGFAFLASSSVQECMDLALVAHLSAIDGSLPFCHIFDGWRTSSEMQTIDVIDYKDIAPLVDWQKVQEFRNRAMNPEHPEMRGTAQDPDVYFQNREAANPYYDALPGIVEANMEKVAKLTGRAYHLFDYVGDPDAEYVIVSMGSSCEVIEETIDYLRTVGYKVGLIKVRLYRPFSAKHLLAAIPAGTKLLCVLDRTKEPGAQGEPLYQDVCTAVHAAATVQSSARPLPVIGGRYGLSSKEFTPSMVKAIFDEMRSPSPKQIFTVGIDDDVTHLSLPVTEKIDTTQEGTIQCRFYGMGSDGTVGATKQVANIIGNNTDFYAQAYFSYSAKKSGGYTISEIRFGKQPIRSAYRIENADYILCNKSTYVQRFDILGTIKEGGIFVLNSPWTLADMESKLPAAMRRTIAAKHLKFYNIDAQKIASAVKLGVRINMIMETVFLKLIGILDFDKAVSLLKEEIKEIYGHEESAVVQENFDAVDRAAGGLVEIDYPESWKDAVDAPVAESDEPAFIKNIARPILALEGDRLPVSAFRPDGFIPMGTTAYEKHSIAIHIPRWEKDKCIECCECSLVCSHAAIRPYLVTAEELKEAPAGFSTKEGHGELRSYQFRIQVYPEDCTGCGSCANICPGRALTMLPLASQIEEQKTNLAFARQHISIKDTLLPRNTVRGSQLQQPLLEFSGACAACGETPYIKLMTQLFGERMLIANATGCSSIWGAYMPSAPYCVNRNGHGPAWANSLFEDNAEFGYGIATAVQHRRERLEMIVDEAIALLDLSTPLKEALQDWKSHKEDATLSYSLGQHLLSMLKQQPEHPLFSEIMANADLLGKKSVWAIGGDGWAYDIGYGGLDHVIASKQNINILVMDTECYSNTGGQTSKATPLGAVAKYAANGKRTNKKELGRMAMIYGDVYVASICLGANKQQAIDALIEAEAYDGPSIVIAYCPCINHGIRKGMGKDISEEAYAVACGYWPLYRFNPDLAKAGKSPLTVDYKQPDGTMPQFLNGEDRYADLTMMFPDEARIIQPELQQHCDNRYQELVDTRK